MCATPSDASTYSNSTGLLVASVASAKAEPVEFKNEARVLGSRELEDFCWLGDGGTRRAKNAREFRKCSCSNFSVLRLLGGRSACPPNGMDSSVASHLRLRCATAA